MNHRIKTSGGGGGSGIIGSTSPIRSKRDKEQTFFVSSKKLDGCFDDF